MILALGESTGHAHAVMGKRALYPVAGPLEPMYLHLPHGGRVVHEEHAAFNLPAGWFRVIRLRVRARLGADGGRLMNTLDAWNQIAYSTESESVDRAVGAEAVRALYAQAGWPWHGARHGSRPGSRHEPRPGSQGEPWYVLRHGPWHGARHDSTRIVARALIRSTA